MKRSTRMSGLLALCLAMPFAGWAEDDSAKARDLAQEFNVSSSQLMDIKTNQDLSWDEIRTSLMISQHSGASLDEVVRLKQSGMSFDDIASRYNLKLDDIEKSHVGAGKKGEDVRDAPSPRRVHRKAARLADEYEVSPDEVMRLHDRGLSWKEVRHALFIAETSGRPVNEIVGLKESGMDWDDIAARYNVNLRDEKNRKERKEQMREAPSPAPSPEGTEQRSDEGTGMEGATPGQTPGDSGTMDHPSTPSSPGQSEQSMPESAPTDTQQVPDQQSY